MSFSVFFTLLISEKGFRRRRLITEYSFVFYIDTFLTIIMDWIVGAVLTMRWSYPVDDRARLYQFNKSGDREESLFREDDRLRSAEHAQVQIVFLFI